MKKYKNYTVKSRGEKKYTNFTSLREARKRGMEYFRQGIFISLINGNNVKLPL